MNVRAHDLLLCWPLVYFHKSQELCHTIIHMCTWHMHCVRTVCSDIKCICHVYRGPLIVQKRSCVRARFHWLAYVPGNGGWGGPPATTITRVHFKHNQHMHVVATLLGRILGISLIVIPMFPSQPFPFVQPHLYRDVRSGILDYTNPTTSHHLLASEGNLSLHFPKLREQENLRALEQKQQAARIAAVQKKLDKLTPVGEFENCCAR